MSENETAGLIGGMVAAIVMAIKELAGAIMKMIKARREEDKEAREEVKGDVEKRDMWGKLNKVDDDLSQHRVDDAAAFATLNANQSTIIQAVQRIEKKVDTISRRQTGKTSTDD